MSHKPVIVLDTGYKSYEYETMLFNTAGFEFKLIPAASDNRAEKIKFAREAVGILIRWTKIDRNFLNVTPNLKAIVRYGVDYENIDIAAASQFDSHRTLCLVFRYSYGGVTEAGSK